MHAGAGGRGLVGRETEQVPEQVRQERAEGFERRGFRSIRRRHWGTKGQRLAGRAGGKEGPDGGAGQVSRGPNHRDAGTINKCY